MTPLCRCTRGAIAAVVAALLLVAAAASAEGGGLARVGPGQDDCVDLRQQAASDSTALDCLPAGTLVVVLASVPGWKEVLTDDGRRGWVAEEVLETESVPAADAEPVTPTPTPETGAAAELESVTRERDDLRLRLGAAEAQIAALLADLQTARAALGTSQAEGAELGSSLETARAESEALTEQLRSSEGRQIFLLSELEKCRAEIRRLERLAALSTPPDPPAPADPALPAPLEPAAPPAEPLEPAPATSASAAQGEVLETLRAWARAWSEQRVEDYLAFYSSEFRPPDAATRADWESARRERISSPRQIEVTFEQATVQVEGDLARASFRQSYRSDRFTDVVSKTLLLRREAGSWRILEETAAP